MCQDERVFERTSLLYVEPDFDKHFKRQGCDAKFANTNRLYKGVGLFGPIRGLDRAAGKGDSPRKIAILLCFRRRAGK